MLHDSRSERGSHRSALDLGSGRPVKAPNTTDDSDGGTTVLSSGSGATAAAAGSAEGPEDGAPRWTTPEVRRGLRSPRAHLPLRSPARAFPRRDWHRADVRRDALPLPGHAALLRQGAARDGEYPLPLRRPLHHRCAQDLPLLLPGAEGQGHRVLHRRYRAGANRLAGAFARTDPAARAPARTGRPVLPRRSSECSSRPSAS